MADRNCVTGLARARKCRKLMHEEAIGYAKFRSSPHPVVIHVYDAAGELIETHERKSQLKERLGGRAHAPSTLYGLRRFVIESQLIDETNTASGWDCGPCFAVASSLPLIQLTAGQLASAPIENSRWPWSLFPRIRATILDV